jgi:DNA recombination protein RmuC
MEFVFLLAGLAVGFASAWIIRRPVKNDEASAAEVNLLRNELQQESNRRSALQSQNDLLATANEDLKTELKQAGADILRLTNELAKWQSDASNLSARIEEHKAGLVQMKEQFGKEFENLANKIFEEKSQKFTEQNRSNIDQILKPLGEKIKAFEEKVQRNYEEEGKEKASLKREIQVLYQLNQQMSKEAQNLTRALKGESKTQGNWGEFILENILERSGLVKDREYVMQASIVTEEGKRYQPDVLINLPEGKTLIIDSKVSLTAYERFYSTEDEQEKTVAIKDHLLSVRSHVKGLGDKNYHNLYRIKTLDFVMMFIPIEPAFALAVQHDSQLFNDAFDKNIVIVSPTTLLASLRTVSSIWRQENQGRNATEIATKAGDLYDKFQGFVNDMLDLGKKLDQSKSTYEDAMKKLSTGRGNVVKQIETLKTMGAKAAKTLPPALLERAQED